MGRSIIQKIILIAFSWVVFLVYADSVNSAVTYKTYGINFSPYINDDEDPDKGGSQITDDELLQRLQIMAPYTEWIRTFGCNDDLKEAGMFAHNMGLKAAVGAWLSKDLTENQNQIDCLINAAKQGYVDIAIVGSEVLLRGDLSESQLISYINQVKNRLAEDPPVNIPVTTADIYGVLLSHPNVISAVDVVLANYYPYWEGRKINYAVAYVHRWHQQLVNASGGKEVIVSETGWPSCGNQIGDAVPSPENASFYFLNFVSWARANNVKYFYFETYDEKWKIKHEGPQGACWGIWDKDGNMKTGMQDVFDGITIPDNWSNPIPEAPIIDFFSLPQLTATNISTFIVAGSTEPGNEVWLNGAMLPTTAMDEAGNFAVAMPLAAGDNLLALAIKSGGVIIETGEKTVRFDPGFSTGSKRLIYVDSVDVGSSVPALPGTVVIDLDNDTLLGLIDNKHVVGISPDGSEIYASDKTVISTDTHQALRTLPFTYDIPGNGFVVSPDGTRLYSRNERLDVQLNILSENLPINITTGSSWAGAPIPGGPTISADGGKIYCCNSISIIDTGENTYTSTDISGLYLSDIALTKDERMFLFSEYSYASGRLYMYDAETYAPVSGTGGLGDYVGEIEFSGDGQKVIVGSAGNSAWANDGRVSVIDLNGLGIISQTFIPLADNLATSGNNEFFVSSGENDLFKRLGVDVYVLEPSGNLVRTKTFYLGVNGFKVSTGAPRSDQIRRIVFKPGVCSSDSDGDGILDDGDCSGTAGDHPCTGGYTANCDDNCIDTPNPDQADIDSDGVGDACDNCQVDTNPDQTDTDGDNFGDVCDNCKCSANALQIDTDSDGYGNRCDADLNNDGIVNAPDFGMFAYSWGKCEGSSQYNPDANLTIENGDVCVNAPDFGIFAYYYGKAVGYCP